MVAYNKDADLVSEHVRRRLLELLRHLERVRGAVPSEPSSSLKRPSEMRKGKPSA